jgi:uncharacterized protein YyaL (SSP411 family)
MSGGAGYEEHAVGVLRLLAEPARNHPQALAYVLSALDGHLSTTREVALIWSGDGDDAAELAAAFRRRYRPHAVLAGGREGSTSPELLADRPAVDGAAAAYVCERFTCKAPVKGAGELERLLEE